MKSVLKVLVLICLVVMSKLAKDESVELQKPVARKAEATPVYTSNIQQTPITPIAESQPSTFSVKFVKGALQVN